MARKKYTVEQIISHLREAEVRLGQRSAAGWNRKHRERRQWVMSTHSVQDPHMSVRGCSSDIRFCVPAFHRSHG